MKKNKTPVVYLIDDDELFLDFLFDLAESLGAVARRFSAAPDFLEAYSPLPHECVVSDVAMPGMCGLELQKALAERYQVPPPIIFVTGFADVGKAVEAMKKGAFDFIEKPISAESFLKKLHGALVFSMELHDRRMLNSVREARMALLTDREREVLMLIVKGCANKEIGDYLGVSVRTVENHRARIIEKFRVKDSVELLHMFYEAINF